MLVGQLFRSTARSARPVLPSLGVAARPSPLAPATAPLALGATRGFASRKHKKFIKLAKGYRGRANRCFRIAVQRVEKAWQYAYRDRKARRPASHAPPPLPRGSRSRAPEPASSQVKKREMRKSWIRSINASTRAYGVPYNRFISGMRSANIVAEPRPSTPRNARARPRRRPRRTSIVRSSPISPCASPPRPFFGSKKRVRLSLARPSQHRAALVPQRPRGHARQRPVPREPRRHDAPRSRTLRWSPSIRYALPRRRA